MKIFLDEPTTAKRAAIFMAKIGLLGQLGRACLMDMGVKEAPIQGGKGGHTQYQ